LARYAQQEDESALEAYIRKPDSNFSADFGLQLCLRKSHQRSVVLIYAKLEMYEESVATALEYYWDTDMSLAIEIARKPDDIDRRKMLMKQIVEFLVDKKSIPLAMDTVQKCPDLLSIEDIIKDLQDDMPIGEIAKELCHSLDQSKKKVEELRNKMQATKETTNKIKEDIKELRVREVILPEDSLCHLSKLPLKGRNFYHYVDGCSFISEALYDHVKKTPMPREKAEIVEKLENDIQTILRQTNVETPEVVQNKSNIEEIMVATNPFYSEYFIQSINVPFIQTSNEQEKQSWKF